LASSLTADLQQEAQGEVDDGTLGCTHTEDDMDVQGVMVSLSLELQDPNTEKGTIEAEDDMLKSSEELDHSLLESSRQEHHQPESNELEAEPITGGELPVQALGIEQSGSLLRHEDDADQAVDQIFADDAGDSQEGENTFHDMEEALLAQGSIMNDAGLDSSPQMCDNEALMAGTGEWEDPAAKDDAPAPFEEELAKAQSADQEAKAELEAVLQELGDASAVDLQEEEQLEPSSTKVKQDVAQDQLQQDDTMENPLTQNFLSDQCVGQEVDDSISKQSSKTCGPDADVVNLERPTDERMSSNIGRTVQSKAKLCVRALGWAAAGGALALSCAVAVAELAWHLGPEPELFA